MAFNYIGIDPGATGALALISSDGKVLVYDYQNSPVMASIWLDNCILEFGRSKVCLEKVHAVQGQGIASTFTFGLNVGIIKGLLIAKGLPFLEVTPQRWQGFAQVPKKKTKSDKPSLMVARQLFPQIDLSLKKHHGRADALLIAYYAKQNNL